MRRREFVTLFCGAASTWPLAARAQRPAIPVVGFLRYPASHETDRGEAAAFREGLKEAGYVEGQNLAIEFRLTNTQSELPALAADLIHRQVAVIAVSGSLHCMMARHARMLTTLAQ